MARRVYTAAGTSVGKTIRNNREQKFENRHANTITVGVGIPRQSDGKVGDITIRRVPDGTYRALVKVPSGWFDINAMVPSNRLQWIDMNLANSWVRATTTVDVPGYFRDANGMVHFRGAIDSGSSATATITTLPVGYRPKFDQFRLILDNSATDPLTGNLAVLKITTAGVVNMSNSGSTTHASLDGITFFALQKTTSVATGQHHEIAPIGQLSPL